MLESRPKHSGLPSPLTAYRSPLTAHRLPPSAYRRRLPFIPHQPMASSLPSFVAAVALAGVLGPPCVRAQASPYLPLDDPRLPLLEHLIERGDIEDPSPMVRPFRRRDAVRVLAAADTAGAPSLSLI